MKVMRTLLFAACLALGLLPLRAQIDRHPGYAPLDTVPAFVKEKVSPQFYEMLETLCHHFRISYDFLTDDTYSEPIAYEFFKRFYDGVKAGDFERREENPPLLNVAMPVQTRTDVQWEWVDSCRVDENLLFAKRKATMRAGNQPRKVPLTIEVCYVHDAAKQQVLPLKAQLAPSERGELVEVHWIFDEKCRETGGWISSEEPGALLVQFTTMFFPEEKSQEHVRGISLQHRIRLPLEE